MDGVPTMIIRGGTSKGAYFLVDDLPDDAGERADLLMRIMGTPDSRQIDGIGGAHPLTSKVAVVGLSDDDEIDVEYLFLQVGVDKAEVSDRQNCGNLLAGVAPFAIERGLIEPEDGETSVRIRMLNTDSVVIAKLHVSDGHPVYEGDTAISGVPGTAAAIQLDFRDIAGSSTDGLFPTGNFRDEVAGVKVTMVDNGMPVVVIAASDMGITGYESCSELESNQVLREKLETIRLEAGKTMGLGDVSATTVPKMTMVSPPKQGGHVSTRTFIPDRCHQAIGVLGAVSAATGCLVPGTVGHRVLEGSVDDDLVVLEHPSGTFQALVGVEVVNGSVVVRRAGIVRTARKLMDGVVFPRSE